MSGLFKRPKVPKPTQQEIASVARQQRALDEETGKNERRLKAVWPNKVQIQVLLEQEALEAIHLVEMQWEQPKGNNNEIA